MKKANKKDTVNLFFSAFLVIAYIVCAHFFTQFASTLSTTASSVISICVYVVFGLLVFYATRVGDGKAILRFSPMTLIFMVLPSLYIIIASLAPGMPLYDVFTSLSGGLSVIVTLACVALGYGIPYMFLSGFETEDETAAEEESENTVVEGGVEADLVDTEDSDEETSDEETETDGEDESEDSGESDETEEAGESKNSDDAESDTDREENEE